MNQNNSAKSKEDEKQKVQTNENESEKNEEEENQRPKNIERFIYVSTYKDSKLMQNLKQLFEEINLKAFKLKSKIEIFTHELTDEEKDNNEIDYISGFQIIDSKKRITILEGISNLSMKKIKEVFPKTQMNTETFKVFSDPNILFNKRIYSKFGLSLKFIKLKHNLSEILTTYEDIYYKSNKNREIYECFLNLGGILRSETMEDIIIGDNFPKADDLLLVERKYADILTEEDKTGICQKKEKKKIKAKDFLSSASDSKSNDSGSYKRINSPGKQSRIITCSSVDRSNRLIMPRIITQTNSEIKINENEISEVINNNEKRVSLKAKLDIKNEAFEKYLKEKSKSKISNSELMQKNFEYIKILNNKKPRVQRFCRYDDTGIVENPGEILFCSSKNNYYELLVQKMREKYIKDKDHFYSYSKYGLSSSFPMVERESNHEYLEYLDNKSKWINKNDFERYKQPNKAPVILPKIH